MKIQSYGGVWAIAKEQSTGNLINGLSYGVYDSNNNLIKSGYTPEFVPISTTGTYNIHFNDYGTYYMSNSPSTTNYNIYNWGGLVSPSLSNGQNARIFGTYYNSANPRSYALMTYQAKVGGSPLPGMYGGFRDSGGNLISQGFTPYSVGVPVNQQLTVYWNNYQTHVISSATTTATQISYTNTNYGAVQVISVPSSGGSYSDTGNFS